MLYILYGKDEYSRQQYLNELKAQLGDPEALRTNTTVLDGQRLTAGQLQEVCGTMPFIGEKRLVIVDGLLGRFEPRAVRAASGSKSAGPEATGRGEEEARDLIAYLKAVPDHTVLVLLDGDIGRNGSAQKNPLLKEMGPLAKTVQFAPLKGEDLYRWIKEEVERQGGRIGPGAARLLAEVAGENRSVLNSEIEKLLLFCGGRIIQEQDVQQVVSSARELTIYDLVDDVLHRRGARAQQRLAQLFDEGASAVHILAILGREMRRLILAHELLGRRAPAGELWDKLDIRADWQYRKVMAQAAKHGAGQLEQVYRRLLEADLSIKTGKSSDQMALTLLVAELARG